MINKKDICERLRKDELFKTGMNIASEDDKKLIQSKIEPMLVDMISQFQQFVESIKSNEGALDELRKGLNGDEKVVNTEPIISGSVG